MSERPYLCKNNNLINKLDLVKETFPQSIFLFILRNPLTHSASLLNTHQRFCSMQQQNNFVLSYMNYLGHFEFGLGFKPLVKGFKSDFEMNNVNFWLDYWICIHTAIIQSIDKFDFLLDNKYIDLFGEKINCEKSLQAICKYLAANTRQFTAQECDPDNISSELCPRKSQIARELYLEISNSS